MEIRITGTLSETMRAQFALSKAYKNIRYSAQYATLKESEFHTYATFDGEPQPHENSDK